VAIDTPEALKASVGRDRVQISTADDAVAIRALAGGVRPRGGRARGPRDVLGGVGRVLRAEAVRRPAGRDQVGQRVPAPPSTTVFMSYTGKTIRDAEASIGDRNRRIATRFGRR